MIYSDLIAEIVSGADEDFTETGSNRAEKKFIDAICTFVEKGEYSVNDLPELIYEEEVVLAASGILQITGATNDLTDNPNIIDVFDVYEDPDSSHEDGWSYVPKELNEIKSISGNAEFEPGDKEIYFYRVGMYLKFYKKSDANGKYATVILIKSPKGDWGDNDEMVGLYSKTFLRRCIALAASLLKSDVEG